MDAAGHADNSSREHVDASQQVVPRVGDVEVAHAVERERAWLGEPRTAGRAVGPADSVGFPATTPRTPSECITITASQPSSGATK